MDHRWNKLSHVVEILSCMFNSAFSDYTHFSGYSSPYISNCIGLYFKIHNMSNLHKESSQICVLSSYIANTPVTCLKSRAGCPCFLGHLPVCCDARDPSPWTERTQTREAGAEALDSQAMTDAVEGWEWELPHAFPCVSVKWVCRTEQSSWLHCVVSIVLKAGRVKVSVYSVSGEGSLPSWLCAHTLEKEKAQIFSSYEGTESMVSGPYPWHT